MKELDDDDKQRLRGWLVGRNGGGGWREKTGEDSETGLKRESVGGGVLGRERGSGCCGGGGVGWSFG